MWVVYEINVIAEFLNCACGEFCLFSLAKDRTMHRSGEIETGADKKLFSRISAIKILRPSIFFGMRTSPKSKSSSQG